MTKPATSDTDMGHEREGPEQLALSPHYYRKGANRYVKH